MHTIDIIIQEAFKHKKQEFKTLAKVKEFNGTGQINIKKYEYLLEQFYQDIRLLGMLIEVDNNLQIKKVHLKVKDVMKYCRGRKIDTNNIIYYKDNQVINIV
ncbi:MAG: hypothetical protein ACRC6X_08225 [Culicoidibacterales bacterium]